MAKVENRVKENPRLEQRPLSDGRASLYLLYYLGRKSTPVTDEDGNPVLYEGGKMAGTPIFKVVHQRKKENLDLYIYTSPRTPEERKHNNEALRLAKAIRQEREQGFLEDRQGYRLKRDNKGVDFLGYYQSYINRYTKADKRMVELSLQRFRDFLGDKPEYKMYVDGIKPGQIDKEMVLSFVEYLQGRSRGEGAKSIYGRFKKVVLYGVEHGIFELNPCKGIVVKVDEMQLRKPILSVEEMKQLAATRYDGQNEEVRRAFLFSLKTGLRFCDVENLTFANVDFANGHLRFEQRKTAGHSKKSGVDIPLNDGLLKLIGAPKDGQNQESRIFDLPTYEACLKALKRWVKRAGINKNISWHCARHSFAVEILNNGANIKTVATLLGHSDLNTVEKYTRVVDRLKVEAINSLPELEF